MMSLASAWWPTAAWAETPAAQTSANVYRSAYFLGRGDTGIAEADNQDAIFYNPAGIAQGKGIYKKTVLLSPQVEGSQGARDVARELSSQSSNPVTTVENNLGKPDHVGVQDFTGVIFRRAAVGVIASSHADLLAFDDPKAGGLEAVHASADETLGATFTLADKFFSDRLMLGVTGKYLERARGDITASAADAATIQSELKDKSKFLGEGTGTGADVGMMFRGGGRINPSFGLVVNDVGNTHIRATNGSPLDLGLRQTINAGVSIEPGTNLSKFKLLFDYRDIGGPSTVSPYEKTHFGAELSVLNRVGVTAGLNQGYPTAGLYFDLYVVRLDLGVYSEEVGDQPGVRPDTRYFVRIITGF